MILTRMSDYIQVVTTTSDPAQAEEIARALVERRLAACVQVAGPIRSIYRWQDRVETDEEWQCTAKTRRDLFPAVETAIRAAHPYEVPEILAVPVAAGSASYLRWLDEELAGETA
jgi:periplasmic divalent cation tolerance protein